VGPDDFHEVDGMDDIVCVALLYRPDFGWAPRKAEGMRRQIWLAPFPVVRQGHPISVSPVFMPHGQPVQNLSPLFPVRQKLIHERPEPFVVSRLQNVNYHKRAVKEDS